MSVGDVRKLASVLKDTLDFLEQKHSSKLTRYTNPPSTAQQFFYLADRDGIVRVEQDAAFVLQRIILPTDVTTPWTGVSFIDNNTGRNLVDTTDRVPQTTFTLGSPQPPAIVPSQVGSATAYVRRLQQLDNCYVLDSAVVLPRAGVVQIVPHLNLTFAGVNFDLTPASAPPGYFVNTLCPLLLGYKVFG